MPPTLALRALVYNVFSFRESLITLYDALKDFIVCFCFSLYELKIYIHIHFKAKNKMYEQLAINKKKQHTFYLKVSEGIIYIFSASQELTVIVQTT